MKWSVAALILCFGILVAGPVQAEENKDETRQDERLSTKEMGEQVQAISKEMTRVFLQTLQEFLDRELDRLREVSPQTRETLQAQLDQVESGLRDNPDNADGHFDVAEIYDRLGDGANAIIHMQQAETLYRKSENIKGLAEARRSLRDLYARYGFKPKDFQLDS